jgi:hypothetical protein
MLKRDLDNWLKNKHLRSPVDDSDWREEMRERDENDTPARWWEDQLENLDLPEAGPALDRLTRRGCSRGEVQQLLQSIYYADYARLPPKALSPGIRKIQHALDALDAMEHTGSVGLPHDAIEGARPHIAPCFRRWRHIGTDSAIDRSLCFRSGSMI